MKDIITAIAITGAAYLLLLLIRPLRRCRRCEGRKVVLRRGKKFLPCERCHATGETYRPGAVIMHRLVVEHFWSWIRERIHDAIAKHSDDSMPDKR